MMTFTTLSQNTRIKIGRDSTKISNKALRSMQREARKCDSVRVALDKKNELVSELIQNNMTMFEEFTQEREKKNEAIKARDEAKRKLDAFDKKRFGIGFSTGVTLDSDLQFKPAFLIGVTYTIFRF